MERAILSTELINALAGERTPKFLATVSAGGIPNIVDANTIIFGEFMVVKTRQNLEQVPEVGVAVFTEDLRIWAFRGRFLRFERTGSYVDMINGTEMFRYNAYSGIRSAGVIEAVEVTHTWTMSKQELLRQMLVVKILRRFFLSSSNDGVVLPSVVKEKFDRFKAVKFLAYKDSQGYPACIPVPSLFSAGNGKMIFGTFLAHQAIQDIAHSTFMAASVITLDPVAYQIKGTFEGIKSKRLGSVGFLRIKEAYSASPPLPGHRIV
jgi:hypothetical protein